MAAIATSLVFINDPRFSASLACRLKPSDHSLLICSPRGSSFKSIRQQKVGSASYQSRITVRASLSDGGKPSTASIFVGGFVLGGIMVGTLACVYAPQISKALAGTDTKDLMRKLPKFIYDEEKALENTRKVLSEKIAQLNAAIDDASSQLHTDDNPNEVAVASGEVEAAL